ncbi:MAG: glycosyltransferase family 4 protein, partial [Candidatus Eremiobacterota bacterium]
EGGGAPHSRDWQQRALCGVTDPADRPAEVAESEFYPVLFERPELPFAVVGMSDVMPYPSRTWSSLTEAEIDAYERAFTRQLDNALREFQPHVLHCHHLWVMTALARRLAPDCRVVASCHGTELRQLELAPRFRERVVDPARKLDAVFALTEAQAADLVRVYALDPGRVHVLGAGYREDVFWLRQAPLCGPVRVTYAGKLSRAKGVPWLLEAAAPRIASGALALDLAGGGSGPEADAVRDQARRAGASLLGMLSQDQLAEQFRRSDLFVLPSFYEGLPLVLLEALACGCRAVVTDLPGVRNWMNPALEPDWVRRLPLPRLQGPDEPVPEDLPDFVRALGEALDDLAARPRRPDRAPGLEACSWKALFQRIEPFYY